MHQRRSFPADARDRWLVFLLATLALLPGSRGWSAEGSSGLFSKGPYIQEPAPGSVTIMWESVTNHPAVIRFGLNESLDRSMESPEPRRLTGISGTLKSDKDAGAAASLTTSRTTNVFYLYAARLTGLKPGTRYSYSVEADGVRTPPRHFQTLDPKAERVRFIAYGDSRSQPQMHAAMARCFDQHSPAFVLHTGDLVARGEDYALWSKEFFTPLAEVIDHVAMFSVIGNHEHDGTNYLRYFDLPGRELWYAVDAGPVHVLALDFRFDRGNSEQLEFARQDLLASQAPWKIVILHTPLFNIGGHGSTWGHTNYLPLFREAQVDLVLAGHSHMYERFRPLTPKADPSAWPITHITTGGGGASLHLAVPHPSLLALETTNHFMVFDATRETLKGEALRADGSVIDRFELRKQDGKLAPDYLAQVYPEESITLSLDVARSLAARAAGAPSTNRPTPVMLAVVPREKAGTPAELEITLAPESAAYYALNNGPLQVTTPPKGSTNVLWAEVLSTGKAAIVETKSGELAPPLVFLARARTADNETVSRGARTRVSKTAAEAAKRR